MQALQPRRKASIRLDFNQNVGTDPEEDAKEALVRNARLITLGKLAAGTMHDTRSFLRVLDTHRSLAIEEIDNANLSTAREMLLQMSVPLATLHCLSEDLLSFGVGTSQVSVVPLRELVDATVTMLRAVFSSTVKLEVHGGKESGEEELCVKASKHEIQQMIVNLVQNAVNAFGMCAGSITITVHRIRRSKEDEALLPGSVQNGFVGFTVSDNAGGMDPETLELLQDPHFSTKPAKQGYGLGLFIVRYIATKLGGTLAVGSVKGEGSTFTVYLPSVPPR